MFIIVNWIFLLILIWMVWRIRNIQDKTLIKQESAWIVGIWVLLSFFQYVFSLEFGRMMCSATPSDSRFVFVMTFWLIFARDILTLFVTVFFCWKVNKDFIDNPHFRQQETADPSLLSDFNMLLESNIPQRFFTIFVQSEQPDYFNYLVVIVKYKIRREHIAKYRQIEEEKKSEEDPVLDSLSRKIKRGEDEILEIAQDNREQFLDPEVVGRMIQRSFISSGGKSDNTVNDTKQEIKPDSSPFLLSVGSNVLNEAGLKYRPKQSLPYNQDFNAGHNSINETG